MLGRPAAASRLAVLSSAVALLRRVEALREGAGSPHRSLAQRRASAIIRVPLPLPCFPGKTASSAVAAAV
jgi:hypothetical protein